MKLSIGFKFLLIVFLPFALLFSSCKKEIKEIKNERRDISITHLAVDPKDSDILYAATDGMGVLKSSDKGKNWSPINRGLKNPRVHFLVVSPFDSNTLYMGTHGGGVYISEDRGVSWREINEGLTNTTVIRIVFDPSDPNTLYLLTMHGGVFKSNNRGEKWIPFSEGLTQLDTNPLFCILFQPSGPPTLYLGSLKNMFKRGIGDDSWRSQKDLENQAIKSMAYDSNKDIFYAGVGFPGRVFRSNDKGETWSPVSRVLGGSIDFLVVDTSTSDLYAAVYSAGILKSTDEGVSWKEINTGLSSKDVKSIAIDPKAPQIIYTGLWGRGVFISTNGGDRWLSLNDKFPKDVKIDLAFLQTKPEMGFQPPKEFYKCNVCHGWTDPILNSYESTWLVTPTSRDWKFTVKRMNAFYQHTAWPSTKDALTGAEEISVTKFLNEYYGVKK